MISNTNNHKYSCIQAPTPKLCRNSIPSNRSCILVPYLGLILNITSCIPILLVYPTCIDLKLWSSRILSLPFLWDADINILPGISLLNISNPLFGCLIAPTPPMVKVMLDGGAWSESYKWFLRKFLKGRIQSFLPNKLYSYLNRAKITYSPLKIYANKAK